MSYPCAGEMPMGGDEAARNTVQPSMRRIVPCCASPHRRDAPRRVSPVPQTPRWRPRRPPRPRHYLPVGRGRRHRPDGAGRPCRHPPSSNASVMRMTTIHAQAERKRQDRSVCRAEKRLCRARMLRVRGLIHPTSAVCATTDTARGEKRLPSEQNQAILKSSGRPLGECRL